MILGKTSSGSIINFTNQTNQLSTELEVGCVIELSFGCVSGGAIGCSSR